MAGPTDASDDTRPVDGDSAGELTLTLRNMKTRTNTAISDAATAQSAANAAQGTANTARDNAATAQATADAAAKVVYFGSFVLDSTLSGSTAPVSITNLGGSVTITSIEVVPNSTGLAEYPAGGWDLTINFSGSIAGCLPIMMSTYWGPVSLNASGTQATCRLGYSDNAHDSYQNTVTLYMLKHNV